jgi:hypothetical protein
MGPDLPTRIKTPAWATPITERVLHRLGRPRLLWIVLWAAVPLISPIVFGTAIRLSGRSFGTPEFIDLAATQVTLAYACFVLLLGVGVLGRQAVDAAQELGGLADGNAPPDLFRGIGSIRGPLALTGIVALIISAGGLAQYGPLPPLAALPLLIVYMVPILTFVWAYLTILADIDRLGRRPLALDLFPQDRTLGLEKLGSLASTGLGLLLLAAVPVLLAGADEPVTLAIGLAIVASTVGVLVLSMWRLHRQMAAAKARYVATARRLYADAYAPVRARPDVETLEARAGVIGAAQALDERAHSLPTWPVDEGTLRFVIVVVTGVVTSLVVRGLFSALEF